MKNSTEQTSNLSVSTQDETYNCRICHDFHFVNPSRPGGTIDYSRVVPCLCVRDKADRDKAKRLLSWCELPPASENMTFEKFRTSQGNQDAYNRALLVASNTLKWLTIASGPNAGKTHLAVSICRAWLGKGKSARYAYVPLLLEELRRGYQNGGNGSYDERFDMFLNVPLLVLDDLGTENKTPWAQEKLDTIVDYRLMHDLSLVVTTNLTLPELPLRIASRLQRTGEIVTILR